MIKSLYTLTDNYYLINLNLLTETDIPFTKDKIFKKLIEDICEIDREYFNYELFIKYFQ